MPTKARLAIAATTAFLIAAPSISRCQSLSDLLNLVSKGNSANDLISTIKSITEVTIGTIDPANGPENAEGKVILYRTASCSHCKRAASYMRAHNVGFVERDVERNSNDRAEMARLKAPGVPTLVFGDKTMFGFDEAKFERNYTDFKLAPSLQSGGSNVPPNNAPAKSMFQSGDILLGKIAGVVVYSRPAKSEKIAVLGKADEVIFMGDESDGYYRVTTQKGEGWIDKLLVRKQ